MELRGGGQAAAPFRGAQSGAIESVDEHAAGLGSRTPASSETSVDFPPPEASFQHHAFAPRDLSVAPRSTGSGRSL